MERKNCTDYCGDVYVFLVSLFGLINKLNLLFKKILLNQYQLANIKN